jgi:curved DNA-binding protein CbpA
VSAIDTAAIFAWLELLDDLDYYELLRAPRSADADEIRDAYYAFAESFHPDGHPGRTPVERAALDRIFKRGNEAYAALRDPQMRERYDAQLGARTSSSPPARLTSIPPARASQAPARLEDVVRSPTARPFARRAEELAQAGDLRQAKLQMVMATHHDPDNDELRAYLRHIDEELKRRR